MAVPLWSLPAALGLEPPGGLVAFVGGGGKTSLLFALAAALPGRVVITTTTRIFAAQIRLAPAVLHADELTSLSSLLDAHGRVLVIGQLAGDKALGVDSDLPARLLARRDVDYVLVEADGSRMRPVKAPADHEPVIPSGATLVVPVAGLDALERPLAEAAHRVEIVQQLLEAQRSQDAEELEGLFPSLFVRRLGIGDGAYLTPPGLARLLTHPEGGLKGAPPGARVIPFLNKADDEARLGAARAAARLMLRESRVSRVVVGAARTAEPVREVWRRVTAIVLAAGESRRMGRNKLLLPWGETTVLAQTLANVQAAGAHDLVVVTGHESDRIAPLAAPAGAPIIHNSDYAQGMLSSVQTAVRSLPAAVDAVLVVLGDQPMVAPAIIDRLLAAYAASTAGLVAPAYLGQRGNPVLIDRRHFTELLALPPDDAPRALLQRHPGDLLLMPVDDEAILHDLDRPEDYERWRPRNRA